MLLYQDCESQIKITRQCLENIPKLGRTSKFHLSARVCTQLDHRIITREMGPEH